AEPRWRAWINDKPARKGGQAAASRPGPNTATVTVPPEQVSVRVLNGTGAQGLAGRVAGELRANGFLVSSTGNASSPTRSSVIRYAPASRAAAVTLAAAVPAATLSV